MSEIGAFLVQLGHVVIFVIESHIIVSCVDSLFHQICQRHFYELELWQLAAYSLDSVDRSSFVIIQLELHRSSPRELAQLNKRCHL